MLTTLCLFAAERTVPENNLQNFTLQDLRAHQHSLYTGQAVNASASLGQPYFWDPVVAGPVPGHWTSHYDPRVGSWVNTWHPQR